MADGSVRFIKESIAPQTYRRPGNESRRRSGLGRRLLTHCVA